MINQLRVWYVRAQIAIWKALRLRKTGDRLADQIWVVLRHWPWLTVEEIAYLLRVSPTFKVGVELQSLEKTRLVESATMWRAL